MIICIYVVDKLIFIVCKNLNLPTWFKTEKLENEYNIMHRTTILACERIKNLLYSYEHQQYANLWNLKNESSFNNNIYCIRCVLKPEQFPQSAGCFDEVAFVALVTLTIRKRKL